jgi:NADH:ubiquinone oxidoreductase subunit E
MPYESGFQQSERRLAPEGEPFAFTPERRAELERRFAQYPPERRKSAIIYALFLVQGQLGHITAHAMRHVAEIIGCTPAEVDDVASYYAMFYRQPVGKYVVQVCRTLSCALKGAERVTEELTSALGISVGGTDTTGTFTVIEVECLGACWSTTDGTRA